MTDAAATRALEHLRAAADDLADRCIEVLHHALGATGAERESAAALERRLTRARRSIEKAISILDVDAEV